MQNPLSFPQKSTTKGQFRSTPTKRSERFAWHKPSKSHGDNPYPQESPSHLVGVAMNGRGALN